MRWLCPLVVLLSLPGCHDDSTHVSIELETAFILDERHDGEWITTGGGLYFRIELSSDDPDEYYWDISHYDGVYYQVRDHWVEARGGGYTSVWVVETIGLGETWMELSYYVRSVQTSSRSVTYYFTFQ